MPDRLSMPSSIREFQHGYDISAFPATRPSLTYAKPPAGTHSHELLDCSLPLQSKITSNSIRSRPVEIVSFSSLVFFFVFSPLICYAVDSISYGIP